MLKVSSKTLFVNFEVQVEVANLKATCEYQAHVSKDQNGNQWDVDFTDIYEISYMGVPIQGYDNFRKFKKFHLEMGIDFAAAIEEAAEKVVTKAALKELLNDITF
jgi:hypothetical protein